MNSYQRIIFLAVILSVTVQLIYIYRIATLNLFLPDDAYYYFSLARNVSEGNGPKVDTFNNTTGFQPLWGALCILAFIIFPDDTVAILSLQLISLSTGLATIWFLYKWMSDLPLPKIAVLLTICWWLLSSQTILNTLNGMETSLAILFAIAVYYSLKIENAWVTGLLCGMAVLARTDAIILVVSITLVWVYKRHFRRVMILWLCILLTTSPWIIFTLSIGKTLLPESGQAVRLITLFVEDLPYYSMGESLWRNPAFHWGQLVSFLNFFGWNSIALYPFSLFPNLSIVLVCLFIILITLYFYYLPGVAIFLLHTLGMVTAYSLFIGGNWFHFRYTISISMLFSALITGLFFQQINKKKVRIAYGILVSAGLIVLHILFNPLLNFHDRGLSLTSLGKSFYDSTIWMNQNIPNTSTVGAFQAGVVSYYAKFPVLNLDGKVNNNAYVALRNKNMWEYICQEEVDYIVDWPSLVDKLLVKRSAQWEDDNLILIKQVSEVNIYAVNHSKCLSSINKSSN